ncbi:MAG: FMN-binding protein [Thermoleophilia bacterium]|nr:FMN-binding protein [Thermoleophilia bacterium]
MRRAHIVIASTVVGLAAVLGYRPNMTRNATSLVSASASTSSGSSPRSSPGPATAASTDNGTKTTAAPAAPGPKTAAKSSTTYTGSNETISENGRQFGEIQAKVTIAGGKIMNVALGKINLYDGHSSQIANYAVPTLLQQTIDAQGASIDGVSGATYTSRAYATSVQAALDRAGV